MNNKTLVSLTALVLAFVPFATADQGDYLVVDDVEVDQPVVIFCEPGDCDLYSTDLSGTDTIADLENGDTLFLVNIDDAGTSSEADNHEDVAIVLFGAGQAGSVIDDDHDDFEDLFNLGTAFAPDFVDDDDSGDFDADELPLIYLDIGAVDGGAGNGHVSTGDFSLSRGEYVTASSDDHDSAFDPLGILSVAFVDLDADGELDDGEPIILNADADHNSVDVGDFWFNNGVLEFIDLSNPFVDADSALMAACTNDDGDALLTAASIFMFVDLDKNGEWDDDEPIAIQAAKNVAETALRSGDVILSGPHQGTEVSGTHALFDEDVHDLPENGGDNFDIADLHYVDVTGDGYDGGELLVLDFDGNDDLLTVGDIDAIFGTRTVTQTAYDIDTALSADFGGDALIFKCLDDDADDNPDRILLGQDTGSVEDEDLYIVGGPFASLVGDDLNTGFEADDVDAVFCAVYEDGDGAVDGDFDAGEEIYYGIIVRVAATCGGPADGLVLEDDVWVAGPMAGAWVTEDDADDLEDDDYLVDATLGDVLGTLAYVDELGNAEFDADQDALIFDIAAPGDDQTSLGDFMFGGPRIVQSADFQIGIAVLPLAHDDYAHADNDDDDEWSSADNLYLTIVAAAAGIYESLAVDDLVLYEGTDLNDGSNTPTSTTTTTTTAATTTTSTATTTTTTSTTDAMTGGEGGNGGEGGEGTETSNGTPGFELVALVAALGAALVLVRRRL